MKEKLIIIGSGLAGLAAAAKSVFDTDDPKAVSPAKPPQK